MPRRKNVEILKEVQSELRAIKKAVREDCEDCSGKGDCKNPDCPLYLFSPFRRQKK
jgi:hypothetical protein